MDLFFPKSSENRDYNASSSISQTYSMACTEIPLYSASQSMSYNVKTRFDGSLTNAKVRCPLCNSKTSVLYCVDCINSGTFYHSNKEKYPERCMSLRVEEMRMLGRVQLLNQEILKHEDNVRIPTRLLYKIDEQRRKNQLMKKVIEEEKENIKQLRRQCVREDRTIEQKRELTARWSSSMVASKKNAAASANKAVLNSISLEDYRRRIGRHTRTSINDLLKCILPVGYLGECARLDRSSPSQSESVVEYHLSGPMEELLLDAEDISGPLLLYTVGGLFLPGNDDILSFRPAELPTVSSVARLAPCPHKETGDCHALRSSAALANTARLLNILAHLSGVTLHHYLPPGEFNEPRLSDAEQRSLYSKLCVNVVQFCLITGVTKMCPIKNLIQNLMVLLNHLPITRDGLHCVIPDDLYSSMVSASLFVRWLPNTGKHYCCSKPNDSNAELLDDFDVVQVEDIPSYAKQS